MAILNAERLAGACAEGASDAGINIQTTLEPLGGDGSPVKPATYEGGRFQTGRRWWGEGAERRVVDILVIDNEPSQANRLEAALEDLREELGLPEIVLDLSDAGQLPPHLPRRISSFKFPHRNADAYLRDAQLDGTRFLNTEVGRELFDATADRAEALLQWCPQALLFGFWQSHLGKKRSQAKLARAWTSEILGIEPAAGDIRRFGLKGDPLNLSVAEPVAYDDTAKEDWAFASKGKKLSEIGHGQVPFGGDEAAPSGVSFREVFQQATVSFASLRRVRTASACPEARGLLVALGLVAHVAAFGRSFSLRSGAELRPRESRWSWLGSDGSDELETLDLPSAKALFQDCVIRAQEAGLPVGGRWAEPLVVQPTPNLLSAINKSWPTD